MPKDNLTPVDLEPEFRRVGTTFQRAFGELARQNAGLDAPPRSLAISVDLERTLQILRTLPDGAEQDAFIAAFKAAFGRRPPSSGGAGA